MCPSEYLNGVILSYPSTETPDCHLHHLIISLTYSLISIHLCLATAPFSTYLSPAPQLTVYSDNILTPWPHQIVGDSPQCYPTVDVNCTRSTGDSKSLSYISVYSVGTHSWDTLTWRRFGSGVGNLLIHLSRMETGGISSYRSHPLCISKYHQCTSDGACNCSSLGSPEQSNISNSTHRSTNTAMPCYWEGERVVVLRSHPHFCTNVKTRISNNLSYSVH
jgi:hypothetical protein